MKSGELISFAATTNTDNFEFWVVEETYQTETQLWSDSKL